MTRAEKDQFAALEKENKKLQTIIEKSADAMNLQSHVDLLTLQKNEETDRANGLAIEIGHLQARHDALAAELNAHRMNGESMTVI